MYSMTRLPLGLIKRGIHKIKKKKKLIAGSLSKHKH